MRAGRTVPRRKVTLDELPALAFDGAIRVQMMGGRFALAARQPSNTALLRLLSVCERSLRGGGRERWP